MDTFSEILRAATGGIDSCYFHLNLDGGDPVYRERVYCYELYHQMRKRWPKECPFVLNGEVDKSAHPILCELGADHAKPDFLVHTPGSMAGNHAIIEVKHSLAIDGIRKDLGTLSLFRQRVGYTRAIYLFYGWDANQRLLDKIRSVASEVTDLDSIEVWLHSSVGQAAEHVDTLSGKSLQVHASRK